MFYTQEEVLKAYQKLGDTSGDTIYVTGNFGALGIFFLMKCLFNWLSKAINDCFRAIKSMRFLTNCSI